MSSCSRHASKEAVGSCINCGKLVCAACHKEIDGKSYCPVCVEKLFAPAEIKLEKISPAVPVVAKSVPLPAKKEKVGAAPVVQEEKSVEPKTIENLSVTDAAAAGQAKVSWLWWIPPIVLGWIGGLISWLACKASAPKTARNMLMGGIGMSVLQGTVVLILIISLVAGSISHTRQSPVVTQREQSTPASTEKPPTVSQESVTSPTEQQQPAENENIIEVMPTRKLTPLPQPISPSYSLNTLWSQNLQPSEEEQTISYGDNLTIVVPAGGLKEDQSLTISEVTNPPKAGKYEAQLAVWDISFEKQHEFDSNLTIKFYYNPSILLEVVSPMSLEVAYFDTETQSWIPAPSTVDVETNSIVLQTTHNGLWQVVHEIENRDVLLTENLAIFYHGGDFNSPKIRRYLELEDKIENAKKGIGTWKLEDRQEYATLSADTDVLNGRQLNKEYKAGIPVSEQGTIYEDNPSVPKYIIDIEYFARNAWKKYVPFGKEPYLTELTIITEKPINDTSIKFHKWINPWIPKLAGVETPVRYQTVVKRLPIYVDQGYTDAAYRSHSKCICMGYS